MSTPKGADLSHWQGDATFSNVLRWAKFVALKACQGTGAADPEFNDADDHRWPTLGTLAGQRKIAGRVAYVFMDGSNGAAQADRLLAVCDAAGGRAHARMALDFEDASATGAGLLSAAERLHSRTGQRCLVYGNAKLRALPSVTRVAVAEHSDLWLADWSAPYTDVPPWHRKFLQYVGIGLDLDEFEGSMDEAYDYFGNGKEDDSMGLQQDTIDMLNGQRVAQNDWFLGNAYGKNYGGLNRVEQRGYDAEWNKLKLTGPQPK